MQHNPYPLISKSLSVIKENILETLAYFDLFDYNVDQLVAVLK